MVVFTFHSRKLPLPALPLLAFTIIISCLAASFFLAQPAQAAWTDIGTSLPDDSYKLYLNGQPVGSSLECYDANKVGRCTAGPNPSPGGSHQYITLSNGSINDDKTPNGRSFGGSDILLGIYTNAANKGNKNVTISVVDRGIGEANACRGYILNYIYQDTDTAATIGSGSEPINGCKSYPLTFFPSAGFKEIMNPNGSGSGIYRGYIMLKLPDITPATKQASIHIDSSSSGVRFGYIGGINGVNTYPTNAADGHKIIYRFGPPCNEPPGSDFEIYWGDGNEGTQYQTPNVPMRIYKQHRDGSNKTEITPRSNTGNDSGRGRLLKTSNYAPETPYVYSVEFDNIDGGNGIWFDSSYDSANFYLDCGSATSAKWHLNPSTGIQKQTDPFKSTGTQTQVRSSAKQAFGAARFGHYLQETLGQGNAKDGDHKWVIKYRYMRNGGVWRTNTTTNDPDGEERPWGDDCRKSTTRNPSNNYCSITVPAGGRVAIKNNSIPGGTLDQVIANLKYIFTKDDGSTKRTPQVGDTYCEELVNRYVKPGNSADSQSGWQCVALTANPPCAAWAVIGEKSVTGDAANGGTQSAAWVNDNYRYNYRFYNGGPAQNTKNINFFPSTGAAYSQVFGPDWRPSYPQRIDRSQGGLTLSHSMTYTPIKSSGADNCGPGEGNNNIPNNIYVPYYYHMTSTSTLLGGARSEQGDAITTKLTVNLPLVDTGGSHTGDASSDSQYGRTHTHSAPTNWRILEFKTTQDKTPESSFLKNKSGNGTCAEIQALIVDMTPGSCSPVASDNQVFEQTDTQLEYPRTAQLDPIGTKICYVGAVDRPVEQDNNPAVDPGSPASRYSDVSCTTIVKSPKVQFTNGDLAVGRSRLGDGGSETACSPLKLDAPIIATGAPSFVQGKPATYPQPTLYGSWVEYGAFAPGTISGFGSAAYSAPNTYKKLTFANTPSTGGYDNYGTQCMNNPFNLVKEPDVNNIDAEADNLTMDTYFSDAAHDTSAKDKTGYVANSKNIAITGTLGDNYDAFRGRDIVIHAKKHAGACGSDAPGDTVGGNITIKNNITYMKSGYGDLTQLPRIILLADCKIIINDGVTNVDAWLVAKDAVQTCSTATGMKFFPDRNVTQGDCAAQLKINGPVQAKRLLLWRTYGSDLLADNPANIAKAAEVFDLRPDQLLATYARGRDAGKPQTVYQTDLPPLY